MTFFSRNIGRAGRVFRAVLGGFLVVSGLVWSGYSLWLCLGLVTAGAFSLFEAARGWCLARACGIKTKL